jgi:hypothetical protein
MPEGRAYCTEFLDQMISNSKSQRFKELPWELHVLLLILLVASQFAPVFMDTVRDIHFAHAIASGSDFPLQGPKLANTVHLGPLWFYILSIPAFFFKSWAAISFMVFLLSGLKFYLAWYLGKQLHSAQLGLAFAVFLALPGWSSAQLIFWTHTSVLETTLLLYLICLQRAIRQANARTWLVSGFTFALALHAHPTALPFAVLLLLAWPVVKSRWTLLLWWGAGAVLLFLPYLLAQLASGFPDFAALLNYQKHQLSSEGLPALVKLIYSVTVAGPNLIYQTVLPHTLARLAIVLHWVMISGLLVLAGIRFRDADSNLRKLLAGAVVMLFLVTATVMLMRARSPWYQAYAPGFVLAFCYGTLATMAYKPGARSPARLLISPLVIMLFAAVAAGGAYKIFTTTIRFQGAVLLDVKNLSGDWGSSGLEFPAFWSRAHGEFLCSQAPLVLHGPYAAVIDLHAGMEAKMSCGRQSEIWLGGLAPGPGYKHWAGISGPMKQALNQPPLKTIGNIYLYRPMAIAETGHAVSLPAGSNYPLRPVFQDGNNEVQQFKMKSQGDSALLISTPVGDLLQVDILQVICNSRTAELLVNSNYSWLYGCRQNSELGVDQWQVRYQSSATDMLDAVLLPTTRNLH